MASIRLDQVRDANFLHQVEEESGQNISTCYQCGNCTAGCPGAGFYDRQVSQIMRAVQLGLKDEALRNKSLWLCLSCSTCTARCPNNIDVARVMETLRHMARREGLVQDRPIESFWKAFLDTVKATGRSFEIGVMADYMGRTLRTGGQPFCRLHTGAEDGAAQGQADGVPRQVGRRGELPGAGVGVDRGAEQGGGVRAADVDNREGHRPRAEVGRREGFALAARGRDDKQGGEGGGDR